MRAIVQYYRNFWQQLGSFKEQTNPNEFWIITAINATLTILIWIWAAWPLILIGINIFTLACICWYLGILATFALVMILPAITLIIRRLNDAGLSWWWILIVCLPFFGPIILLILLCLPTKK